MLLKFVPFAVSLAFALPVASTGPLTTQQVPANLEVPEGYSVFSMGHATGTQNYICLPAAKGMAWTFLGPQATLFDGSNEQVMTHFLSPNPDEGHLARATWQDSRDSSAIWAAAIATSNDPAFVEQGAIPWLLLRVVGAEYGPSGGDRLVRTAYIQRVNTSGGVAPAVGCTGRSDLGKRVMVPYTTDYVFYR